MDRNNPFLMITDILGPYLPSSVLNPLEQIFTIPQNLYHDPSQFVPLLISLFTLYMAVMSFYSSARWMLRTTWFFLKWGAIIAGLGAAWGGVNNGWGGALDKAGAAGNVGKSALNMGKKGVEWWAHSSGLGSPSSSSSSSSRSASGRKRTWATANENGGWDDPDEVDIGQKDAIKNIQNSILHFLSPDQSGSSTTTPLKKKKGTSKKAKETLPVPGGNWMTQFAVNRAKQTWDNFVDSLGESGAQSKTSKRGNR